MLGLCIPRSRAMMCFVWAAHLIVDRAVFQDSPLDVERSELLIGSADAEAGSSPASIASASSRITADGRCGIIRPFGRAVSNADGGGASTETLSKKT